MGFPAMPAYEQQVPDLHGADAANSSAARAAAARAARRALTSSQHAEVRISTNCPLKTHLILSVL